MQTCIATVSLSGSLDEKLKAIAAAGFQGVEIFENDFLSFDGGPRDVGRMIADLGLKTVAFQPFRDFEGMPEPQRSRNFSRAERKFDVMQELGADLLLVCSNVSPSSAGSIDRSADDFRELGERAAARGLKVGFEALAWGRYINDYRDAWEVVRRADHCSVGLVLDSFHTLARKLPVEPILGIPADKIVLVQLADAPRLDYDILSWSRHFRCFPGQGSLPILDFVKAVAATGYAGALSLEIFNDQFRAGSASRVAMDGLRSLVLLDDELAGSNVPMRAARRPLPKKAVCAGVEFVEFAVNEETADELQALFTAMGFRKTGIHRSKSVERWGQGDVNLIINTEKDGFAHSHYIVHGPGVCAFALKVTNAGETMSRAESLKAQTFRQPIGPGELEIPAIRGVGNSLIYFLDQAGPVTGHWERDFLPVDGAPPTEPAHLQVVDHIAQLMHYDEMLSWLLFYLAIFRLQRTPEQDIADPGGLVQSQALQTDDGALRIVLNGSSAMRTAASRFLSDFFGSGVQHVAFVADDIFAAVRTMRAKGLKFLDIPDNYYDDIEAKYDLDPALADELRRNRILYDRDGNAEFFQIFTHLIADVFFFEIVERRGYGGYGAVNASIRLAAQAREGRPPGLPRL
jgi:4-hydroxyphenylpyruvate dioxygenase